MACPQFFMLPFAKPPFAKNDCCKADHCQRQKPSKTTATKECTRMPLEQPGPAHQQAELPVAIATPSDLVATMQTQTEEAPFFSAVQHSPPDLNVLHSTFLI